MRGPPSPPRALARRRSSFIRAELSGSYRFATVVGLGLLIACYDRASLTWSSVQLARQISPFLPQAFERAEAWCWREWASANASALVGEGRAGASQSAVLEFTPEQFERADPPLDRPWIARGLLLNTPLHRKWTIEWLSQSPGRGDLVVDYFSDARLALIVPDTVAPLRDVLALIAAGGPQKLGTEMVFRAEREAVADLAALGLTAKLGAHYFTPAMLGTVLTMPLFSARGFAGETTRTDLHCEPIANAVMQLQGDKLWTFLAPEHSHLVMPQVSPDGRAYFYSRLEHSAPQFRTLPRQTVVSRAGDVIFVPTWTWHRVDYQPDVMSVSVSLFHFNPVTFVRNHPLYAALLLPNLIKEALGLKAQ
ncbi:hypothetical protein T492DRAFT_604895 [Pavlovales sp. CCMP2436]|nr:hypothetical protein T492DRAFT_604895 [Pavlovales sp. CCMP2436]